MNETIVSELILRGFLDPQMWAFGVLMAAVIFWLKLKHGEV